MRNLKAVRITAGVTGAAAIWTMTASVIFLAGTRLITQFEYPLWQWWVYLPYYANHPLILLWLQISGGAATVVVLAMVLARFIRSPDGLTVRTSWLRSTTAKPRETVRGSSDNHGHASWMTEAAMMDRFPGPDIAHGGVVVGECYRVDKDSVADRRFKPEDRSTWGKGGTMPLLIDPCTDGPGHSLVIAGSNGFKTTSAIVSLLYWKTSAVVLDPSCEVGPMLAHEKRLSGHRVVQLSVGGDEAFNVLSWIDITSPLAGSNVHAIIGWCFGDAQAGRQQSAEDQFFRQWGKQLAACLLAHMLWSPDLLPQHKTVRTWRAGIATPEKDMRKVLRGIHAKSESKMARQLAGSLMDIVDETFSGVYANANGPTAWLSDPVYAAMLSDSTFTSSDITKGRMTIFLQLPLKVLQDTPALGRMIIGSMLNEVYEADGNVNGRVLFLLDEVFQLGYMKALTVARDLGRKYRITLQLLYQAVSQLDLQWTREGRRAWYDGVSWRSYGSIQDSDAAKELSDACGNYAVIAISEGDNKGSSGKGMEMGSRSKGSNASRHEIRRALILPEELTQDSRADEVFVIARGCKPIRCGRAISFRRPEIMARVKVSKFANVYHG